MTDAPRFSQILYATRDGIAQIVLNRPERLNALGFGPGSIRDEIVQALAAADADDAVGAVVLSGAGRAFCGGGDLAGVVPEETPYDAQRFGETILAFYTAIRSTHKPVIAAVHGLCIGAGLGLIAQCDLVVASEDARFGLIEGRMGLPGAAEIVPLVGAAWAKFLIFTGELIDARRAERIGLILTVVPRDELVERCTTLGRRIASLPRESVALNKLCIDSVFDAMGRAMARLVGRPQENATKSMGRFARAPDGRLFADILRSDGVDGVKRARDAQYTGSWLDPSDKGS